MSHTSPTKFLMCRHVTHAWQPLNPLIMQIKVKRYSEYRSAKSVSDRHWTASLYVDRMANLDDDIRFESSVMGEQVSGNSQQAMEMILI